MLVVPAVITVAFRSRRLRPASRALSPAMPNAGGFRAPRPKTTAKARPLRGSSDRKVPLAGASLQGEAPPPIVTSKELKAFIQRHDGIAMMRPDPSSRPTRSELQEMPMAAAPRDLRRTARPRAAAPRDLRRTTRPRAAAPRDLRRTTRLRAAAPRDLRGSTLVAPTLVCSSCAARVWRGGLSSAADVLRSRLIALLSPTLIVSILLPLAQADQLISVSTKTDHPISLHGVCVC